MHDGTYFLKIDGHDIYNPRFTTSELVHEFLDWWVKDLKTIDFLNLQYLGVIKRAYRVWSQRKYSGGETPF
jgi:hypothetical protein